jgi:MFS family permease
MVHDQTLKGDTRLDRAAKLVVSFSGLVLVIAVPVAMVPALPELAHEFGGNTDGAFRAQTILTIPTLLMLIGAPLGGWAARLIGIRLCLLVSSIAYVITGAFSAATSDLPTLIAIRLLLGLSAGVASTLCTTLTAEWYEGDRRNRVLGYAHGVSTAYNIFMLLTGGWLVDAVGWRGTSVFYGFGILVFGAAWLVAPDQRKLHTPHRRLKLSASLWTVFPLLFLTFILASGTCMPIMQGPFLLRSLGLLPAFYQGLAAGFVLLIATISSASYGYIQRRLGNFGVFLITIVSMAAGISLAGISPDLRWIGFSYLLIGLGFGLYVPVIAAVILERVSPEARAPAIGLMTSSVLMASFANPSIIAFFRQTFDLRFTFVLIGAAICVISLMFIPSFSWAWSSSKVDPVSPR